MSTRPDPVYDAIAGFAGELVRGGVSEVVISPGSRSTPLALTLDAQPALRTWVLMDERSAAFFALGLGRATGRPAVLVCTSGTAAANYLPALVEAHHAGVPVIACTADRPPELRGWGAGQTIDQVNMFGGITRWAADLPVGGEAGPIHLRLVAKRAVTSATGPGPGPVHLNWPFREPLEPAGDLPVEPVETAAPPFEPMIEPVGNPIPGLVGCERGVIVVGPSPGLGLEAEQEVAGAVAHFSGRVEWPIIAEPATHLRRDHRAGTVVVAAADRLLSDEAFAARMVPEVVIRIGNSPTTKPVRLWLERHRPARVLLVDPGDNWNEASFTLSDHLRLDPRRALVECDPPRRSSPWLDEWRVAEDRAQKAIRDTVDGGPLLSAEVSRTITRCLPRDSVLMVSNSMPVRDLDAFSGGRVPVTVVGNRGASGIDGVTSTALGLAASRSDRSAALYTGDLALLHDLSALVAAARLGLHLTVVCVDNDGGGIFSMLPIATRVPAANFETLFRTPHGLDLGDLDGVGGVRAHTIGSAADLGVAIEETMVSRRPGVDLLVVPVDRDDDVAQHRAVTAAVSAAIGDRG